MTEFVLTLSVCGAAGWLGLSTYLGLISLRAAHLHAHYANCPRCQHHHFARWDGSRAQPCR